MERIDTQQTVELAEGVEIRLRTAGPMLRASAYAIDFLIRLAVLLVAVIVVSLAGIAVGERVAEGLILLSWFLLDWFYPVVFESGRRGATPGKRAMGLRVVQANGSPITVGQAVVRNFLRFIDGMPFFTYGFGMASCLASRRFQRLGDLAAGTVVVYARLPAAPSVAVPDVVSALAPPVALAADEVRALTEFRERAALWSEARRVEIADQASELSGATGRAGVERLMAMALWFQERRGRG